MTSHVYGKCSDCGGTFATAAEFDAHACSRIAHEVAAAMPPGAPFADYQRRYRDALAAAKTHRKDA